MSGPWIICPACRGDGTCVNPNIDSHGLTAEDFAADPDFGESYASGIYDVTYAGFGKIRKSRLKELDQAAGDPGAGRPRGWPLGARHPRLSLRHLVLIKVSLRSHPSTKSSPSIAPTTTNSTPTSSCLSTCFTRT